MTPGASIHIVWRQDDVACGCGLNPLAEHTLCGGTTPRAGLSAACASYRVLALLVAASMHLRFARRHSGTGRDRIFAHARAMRAAQAARFWLFIRAGTCG